MRDVTKPVLSLALLFAACVPQEESFEPPPLFNAVDTSLSCPADRIGWDFSTGGSSGASFSTPSSIVHIIQATYGQNCGDVAVGNWTGTFANACNGTMSCTRNVALPGEPDPHRGCGKEFSVTYSCGDEPNVYRVEIPGESGGQPVTLSCGSRLYVVSATYASPRCPSREGNATAALVRACNGQRRCRPEQRGNDLFGSDPCPRQEKAWKITYAYESGAGSKQETITFPESQPIDILGPAVPTLPGAPTLQIESASWGLNRGEDRRGNATAKFGAACNGRTACSRKVGLPGEPDPAYGDGKEFRLRYRCSDDSNPYKIFVPAEARDKVVSLQCGAKMKILSASYAANVNAAFAGNFTERAKAACDTRSRCRLGQPSDADFDRSRNAFALLTGNRIFGSDPAPNKAKRLAFQYTCGTSPTPIVKSFAEEEPVDFECALSDQPSTYLAGIHIEAATYGANCATSARPIATNNVYTYVTSTCLGKDTCGFTFDPMAAANPHRIPDPADGCDKELQVSYRCGNETELHSASLPTRAEGKFLSLSCSPVVNVVAATRRTACGTSTKIDDFSAPCGADGVQCTTDTGAAQAACDGVRGACSFNPRAPAAQSTCASWYEVSYACGSNPAVRTARQPRAAFGGALELSCLTEAGAPPKACVPRVCSGRERRNLGLECVRDNTIPVIPPFAGTRLKVNGTPIASEQPLTQDTAYALDLEIQLAQPLAANLLRVPELARASVYAFDSFRKKPNVNLPGAPDSVEGFRCLVGTMGLAAKTATLLAGRRDREVVGPACYGDDTNAAWTDASKRLRLNERDFRNAYMRDAASQVRVVFDPEGQTLALRNNGTNADNAISPNPIGFFYHSDRVWVDFVSYYRQTEVAGAYWSGRFPQPRQIQLDAEQAVLRTPMIIVPKYPSPAGPPAIDVDFTWSKSQDVPGVNPFSPTTTPLSRNVKTLEQRRLGATVLVQDEGRYQATRTGDPSPSRDAGCWSTLYQHTPNAPYFDLPLKNGSALGRTERLHLSLPPEFVKRLMNTRDPGPCGNWMNSPLESQRTLRLWVCMNTEDLPQGVAAHTPGAAVREVPMRDVRFGYGFQRRCVMADKPLVIQRDLSERGLPYGTRTAPAGGSKTISQGRGAVNPQNDSGSENGCAQKDGVTDCSSRQAAQANGLQNEGMGGSMTGQQQEYGTGSANKDGTEASYAAVDTEVRGFTISMPGAEFKRNGNAELQNSLTLMPPWELIVEAFKKAEDAAEAANSGASPVGVYFTAEEERFFTGDQGIGLGLKLEIKPSAQNPIPVEIEITISASVGITFTFSWSDFVPYTCVGTGPCIRKVDTRLSQGDAQTACGLRGGTLASPSTADEWNRLTGAVRSGGPYWIGGQLGYVHTDAECATKWTPGCAGSTRTNYEWIDKLGANQLPFVVARSVGANQALLNPATEAPLGAGQAVPGFGGTSTNLQLRTKAPAEAGFTFTGGSNVVGSALGSDALGYVCEYPPAAMGSGSSSVAFETSLAFGAGVALAACIPTGDVGLCLAMGVNLLEASLAFEARQDGTVLYPNGSGPTRYVGRNVTTVKAALALLTGELAAELHLTIFTIRWILLKYVGAQWEWTLWERDQPYDKEL